MVDTLAASPMTRTKGAVSYRRFFLHVFLGNLSVQADLHPGVFCHPGVSAGQLIHLVFKGQGLLTLEDTAQLGLSLAQNDLMAPLGGGVGRIQTAGTSACHQNLLLLRSRMRDCLTVDFRS